MIRAWHDAAVRAFESRSRRERAVVLATGLLLVFWIGVQFWIEPASRKHRLLEQRIAQQQTDLLTLGPELLALRSKSLDPDAARRAQLDLLRTRLALLDDEFAQQQRSLVTPREMGQLIEGMLKQHGGLQIVALRSLPVIPLTPRDGAGALPDLASANVSANVSAASAPGAAARAAAPAASAASAASAAPEAWLYLHGMQLTVQGDYNDMQAYLDAIEHLPRHLYWGPLKVDAQAWPASVMTVTLYTVSLDRAWWSV